MDYSELDDKSLLRLIAVSKTEALSELYDRYSRLVYSLAVFIVGDAASAEEITQDVFVRVWEKADTYQAEQAKVSTWLTSITRNRSIDMIRRRQVRPEGHKVGWDETWVEALPATNLPDPEEEAVRSIESDRIKAAIARLPPDQMRVLSMAYFGGYSQSEIAAMLGEPLGTVKTRIRAAMQKLRALLQDEFRS